MKKFVLIMITLFVVSLFFLVKPAFTGRSIEEVNLDKLSNCIGNNSVMYGIDWSPLSITQKEIFGDSFLSINYVNCDFNNKVCLDKKITNYPAWEIDGKIHYGVKKLKDLAKLTNCSI